MCTFVLISYHLMRYCLKSIFHTWITRQINEFSIPIVIRCAFMASGSNRIRPPESAPKYIPAWGISFFFERSKSVSNMAYVPEAIGRNRRVLLFSQIYAPPNGVR